MKKKIAIKKTLTSLLVKGAIYVAVVAGTIMTINYFTNDNTKNTVDTFLGLDPNATAEQQQKEQVEEADSIAIPGFDKFVFQAESVEQDVTFENPEQNDVYFIVSLSIDDAPVYESKLIEPGKGVYSIELPAEYAEGEYAGKLTYETRSMNNPDEKKNGAAINVPIIFE